jgi:hypothetical protein
MYRKLYVPSIWNISEHDIDSQISSLLIRNPSKVIVDISSNPFASSSFIVEHLFSIELTLAADPLTPQSP